MQNTNKTNQNQIGVLFLLAATVFGIITIIAYNKEIQERPLIASIDFKNSSCIKQIQKPLSPSDNSIRIVARYVASRKNNNDQVELNVSLLKDNVYLFSKILKPVSTTGYSGYTKYFKRQGVGYWDYGTFNISSKGEYQINILPNIPLEYFSEFDVFVSKNNSRTAVYLWGILAAISLLLGMFFGRNIKITLKK